MVIPRSRLTLLYGVIAVLALIATWHQNLHYFGGSAGPAGVLATFWKETFANPAAASITLDLFLFALAVMVWMVHESRRLGIAFVWLYIVLGLLIAISFTFPLFMIARERRLATLGQVPPGITTADAIGLVVIGVPITVLALWSLFA